MEVYIGKLLKTIYRKLYSDYGPQHWWPGDTPFEVAVGAILTQNTNWDNVERAIRNLKAHKALGAKKMNAMPTDELAELIRPAGYFNVKAKRLKSFLYFFAGNYDGSFKRMGREDTSVLREELLGVNGIGPETADSILLYALGRPVFVIDAYTRRVLSRHGIMGYDEPYDMYQKLFHSAIRPETKLFNEYHALLVRVGKTKCRPRIPLCGTCPLEGV